jgi:membrane protein
LKKLTFKKVFILTKKFLSNLLEPKVSFYAASMSWATLFFIIPFFVIIFAVVIHTPMFSPYYEKIHSFVKSILLPGNSELIMNWIDTFVANATKLGIIGFIYVVIASIMFFRDFDYIVNDIFDNSRRNFFKGVVFYTSLILLIPIALIISIWFLMMIKNKFHFSQYFLQFFIIWLIVFIIYKITPKENLPTHIVAISSFIATFTWTIAKTLFVLYISLNQTYSTIYGAISIVLFLFLWIYISWAIFLHGLQLCSILVEEDEK